MFDLGDVSTSTARAYVAAATAAAGAAGSELPHVAAYVMSGDAAGAVLDVVFSHPQPPDPGS